jgi:D-alanyl-D-alanine carboxypeptidase
MWLFLYNSKTDENIIKNQEQLKKLDQGLSELKTKVALEKQAQEEAAKAAKKASDDAIAKGTTPEPVTKPSSVGGPHMDPSKIDVIVNKKHPISPLSYLPSLQTVTCNGGGTSATISSLVTGDFRAMCDAANAAGTPLGVTSSFRSYSTQISTYNYWVSTSGVSGADTYSARPGYSEHQTGFSVDFSVPSGPSLSDFTGSAQQIWLQNNAYKFGFIQRYTQANTAITGYNAESWHYRYIGRENAAAYTASSSGSLEQFWNITGGEY